MGITVAQLIAEVKVSGADTAKSQLKGIGQEAENTRGGFLKMALGVASGMGIYNLAAGAFGFLKDQLKDCFQESMDAQAGMAQTVQVLKSTHDASGMTAQAVADLAGNLSHLTRFSDDTVQAGENMLLTFTNIGKNVFPEATKTVLDMSQALGQDTKSSAIQLGKALNDPIAGISALSRVGVTFDDQQKKLIKTYMAHNEVAKAQGVILKELQKEFGGSAEAAGKTFAGQLDILHQKLADVKQNIGDALLPILQQFVGFISNSVMPILDKFSGWIADTAVPALQKMWPYIKIVGDNFAELGRVVGQGLLPFIQPILDKFGKIGDIFSGFQSKGAPFLGVFGQIDNIFEIVTPKVQDFFKNMQEAGRVLDEKFGPSLKRIGDIIGGALVANFKFVIDKGQELTKWFQGPMMDAIQKAMPGFEHLGNVLLNQVAPAIAMAWAKLQDLYRLIADNVIHVFEKVTPLVVQLAGAIADKLASALTFITPYFNSAVTAIDGFAHAVSDRARPIVDRFFAAIQAALPALQAIWNSTWAVIGNQLAVTWQVMSGAVQIAWNVLSGIILTGLDVLSGNWGQAWEDIKNSLAGTWNGMQDIVSGGLRIFGIDIGNFGKIATNHANDMKRNVSRSASDMDTNVKGSLRDMKDYFIQNSGEMSKTAQGIYSNMAGNIAGNGDSTFANLDQNIKDYMNSIAAYVDNKSGLAAQEAQANFDKIHAPNLTGTLAHLNVGSNASGTDYWRGGPTWVGEKGPELVYLPRGAQVIPNNKISQVSAAPSQSSSGSNQPIILQIDGHTFARVVMPYLVTQIRYNVGTHGM